MSSSVPDTMNPPGRWWLRALGLIWLAGFLWWFYSFTLSNASPVSRTDVWILLPDILWANISPDPLLEASSSGWRFLPQRIDLMVVAAMILAGAWGMGNIVLRMLRLRGLFDAPTHMVFSFAVGLSGLSLMTLMFGLAGFLDRRLMAGVLFALFVSEALCRIRGTVSAATRSDSNGASRSGATNRRPAWWNQSWDILPTVCLLTIAPFVLAMLLGAMLPSTDFDVKEYHLEGPKEYFQQGRVGLLSHNVYTSFPFLTEMLSLLAMALRDDWFRGALAGKIVLMTMAPLTAVALFAAGRRWFGSTVGWLCVVVYLTIPWVHRISIIAYAEGGLTFYLFATLLAVLWLTVERPESGSGSFVRRVQDSAPEAMDSSQASGRCETVNGLQPWPSGHVLLCGLLAGSAAACKYPGLVSVVIPMGGLLLLAAWRRTPSVNQGRSDSLECDSDTKRSFRRVAITVGLFSLGTMATFGPWMAKNVVETGNPVYPLLYGVFGGHDWDEAAHTKWQNAHPPMILRLIEDPSSLAGNLTDRLIDVSARSDWQSPLLFGCAPLALGWIGRRRLVWCLWCYVGWLFLLWWALTHHIDRFWIPMLPVVTLLAGAGLGWLLGAADNSSGNSRRWSHYFSLMMVTVVAVVIGAAALFNLGYITSGMCGYNAYLTDLEVAKRDTTTRSIAFLNSHLPDNARVLIVGGAEVFDAEFDYLYNTVFDESIFEQSVSAAQPGMDPQDQPLRSTNEIRKTFRQHGITHVFVDWNEVLRHRVPGGYGFTDFVSPARFQELSHLQILKPVALDVRRWEGLNQPSQTEIEQWSPSLHLRSDEEEVFLQYELFAVR